MPLTIRLDKRHFVDVPSIIVFREGEITYALDTRSKAIVFGDVDSALVIQKAVDYLRSGRVVVREGEYTIKRTVNIHSHIVVEGVNAKLVATGDYPVFSVVGSDAERVTDVVIGGFEIVGGGKTNPKAHGIYLEFTNFCKLHDLRIMNCREAVSVKDVYGNIYEDVVALDNYMGFHSSLPTSSSRPMNNFVIRNYVISMTDYYGALMEGISGCKVYGLVVEGGGLATPSDGIVIKGGELSDFIACVSRFNGGNGWYLTPNNPPWNVVSGVRLVSPTSSENSGNGVVLDGVTHVEVVGGEVRGNIQNGVVVKDSTHISIEGLHVVDNSRVGSGQASGILISGTSTRVHVVNCHVIGSHKYGVEEVGNVSENLIALCNLGGYVVGPVSRLSPTSVAVLCRGVDL